MNAIFTVITVVSLLILTIINPTSVVSVMSGGVEKAITLAAKLLCVYTLWYGVFELIESGGIGRLIAKILKKPVGWIFGKTDEKSSGYICMNLSANLLGLGGVATPMGIEAERSLEKANNRYGQNMLFVLASSSVQLLPISVIGLKASFGSVSPQDIILPTLLSTAVSTISGILLVKIFCKR